MLNTSDIKRRIKSVSETRQITKAMELISVSKMRKSIARYESSSAYFEKVRYTIKDILIHTHDITHKYIEKRDGNRTAYIVVAGDKGLAGGFNDNILNMAWNDMKNKQERYVITIGQMARAFFESKGQAIDLEFTHVSQNPALHDARGIERDILGLYDLNLVDEVYIVYTQYVSSVKQTPQMVRLLPLGLDELEDVDVKETYQGDIGYDPTPKDVLNVLVPQYIIGTIYTTLIQSIASEHCARMTAMSSANKNADKMLDELNLQYNRARQEGVTNELLEIVSSSSAR